MSDGNGAKSPLASAAGVAGADATAAFEALSNETRLAILLALWEAVDPFGADGGVRFTDLRQRVGVRDSGQFSYHLERLVGRFVEETADGYRLRDPGLELVQAIIAGAGIEEPRLEPTPVDMTCSLCGGDVEVLYRDGWVYNRCTECEGLFADDGPSGQLSKFDLAPAGLVDRTPAEAYAAGWVRSYQRIDAMIEGVCPTCSGRVERSLVHCDDHDSQGTCDACGRRPRLAATLGCTVCKERALTTIGSVAKYHPAAVAFLYERGLQLQYGANDLAHIRRRLERGETDWALLAEDPIAVRVTIELDGDELWIDLEADLTVRDVSR
jgi:DNA-binding transcriptional ArsR family regulator